MDIKITLNAPELAELSRAILALSEAIALNQENGRQLVDNFIAREEAAEAAVINPALAPVQPAPQPAVPVEASVTPPAPAQAPTVPTSAQTYTMEQLAVAATQLMDAGRRQELVNLLGQFGVQALTALPKEQYGAFATALRQMGAKI